MYSRRFIRRAAREIYAVTVAERDLLRQQFTTLQRQQDELLGLLRETQSIVREARQEAEVRVAAAYRERDLRRGLKAERDPNRPLN